MNDINHFDLHWEEDGEGCRIWDGSKDGDGYGHFQDEGRPWGAHRWLFRKVHGFLPPVVMHHCDKPACVRISCLMPGTVAENNADRQRKGRSSDRRGSKCPTAKLTSQEVREIRSEAALGVLTQRMLADVYGVAQSQVSAAINRKQWVNV
jgi:hypothetical protein